MSAPHLITLGCRLNHAESEAIAAMRPAGDLVVVNSCAVTAQALADTRKAIRRARRERPGARLLVTGCAVDIEPALLAAMPEVDGIVPNSLKLEASRYGASPAETPTRGRTRAFVPVQTGCDHDCTFCIIPKGRGASRSTPAGVLVETIARLVDADVREVVLTGVDVTAYGGDLPGRPSLGNLVERILTHVPRLERLRLSSLDSVEIDDRLFALVTQEPRVMPHLHLSLQAGDDLILKRMKRRHSRADAIRLIERLKAARPEIAIGADLIAGFPTESDAAAANSLALIEEGEIVHAHIFAYSARAGTPAARMPQVPAPLIRARAAALRSAARERHLAWLRSLVGTEQQVLVERDGRSGHAAGFAKVGIEGAMGDLAGRVIRTRIAGVEHDRLIGVAA